MEHGTRSCGGWPHLLHMEVEGEVTADQARRYDDGGPHSPSPQPLPPLPSLQVLFDLQASPYNMVMVPGNEWHGTPAIPSRASKASDSNALDHDGIGVVVFTKVIIAYGWRSVLF